MPKLDKPQPFLVKLNELEGRFDPHFYNPELSKLDSEVKAQSKTRLKDLIVSMHSGATPPKSEQDKYYANKETGIPLLRVQNITEEGLNTGDCVYINRETHENYLKRSQVFENDLIVTITGRIASSAVVPKNFVGNINQHSVVIKTDSRAISEYLAAFLNSNVGQKIALKRATGGTRPALDYVALKNIPIVENLPMVAKMDDAYASKKQKEAEAQRLLGGIDEYLLSELGIDLPELEENTIENRIFTRNWSEVTGGRFDPKPLAPASQIIQIAISQSAFQKKILKKLIVSSISGEWGKDEGAEIEGDYLRCLVIRSTEFDNLYNLNFENSRIKYRLIDKLKLSKLDVQKDDILIEKSGGAPDQPVGRVAILSKDALAQYDMVAYGNFIQKIRVDKTQISPPYLYCFLKTIHNVGLTDTMQNQTTGIRNLIMSEYFAQQIPLPPIEKQKEIADHIGKIRDQAKQLQSEAKAELEQAKKEVEAIILGE